MSKDQPTNPKNSKCPECGGYGELESGYGSVFKCPDCNGTGYLPSSSDKTETTMREIKFRAWDKEADEMLWDFFIDMDEQKLYWDADVLYDDMSFAESGRFNLMQYTGLKDKNGVEIYEGDILGCDSYRPVVDFNDGEFVLKEFEGATSPCRAWYIENNRLEVIGNIYENPELLEANQ